MQDVLQKLIRQWRDDATQASEQAKAAGLESAERMKHYHSGRAAAYKQAILDLERALEVQ